LVLIARAIEVVSKEGGLYAVRLSGTISGKVLRCIFLTQNLFFRCLF